MKVVKEAPFSKEALSKEALSKEVLSKETGELLAQAREAMPCAYAVYSGFCVGAAVLWASGRITRGCNVENASYGLTMCAERVALFAGIAQGERAPRALAVVVAAEEHAFPCGACLQVMAEWARELPLYLENGSGEVWVTELRALLPRGFVLRRDDGDQE